MEACGTIYDDGLEEDEDEYWDEEQLIAVKGILEDMKHTCGEGGNRDKKLWEIGNSIRTVDRNTKLFTIIT